MRTSNFAAIAVAILLISSSICAQPATCVAGSGGAIPDGGEVVRTVVWPQSQVITDIAVTLNISHPRADDLDVQIINQATASRARLFRRLGVAGGFTGGQTFTIWDGAAQPIGAVLPPPAGSVWTTEGGTDLASLIGQPAAGLWILTVADNRSGSVGSLLGWSLCITGSSNPVALGAIVAPVPGAAVTGIVPAQFEAAFTAADRLYFSFNEDAGPIAYNSAVPGSVLAGTTSTWNGAVLYALGVFENAANFGGVAWLPTGEPLDLTAPFTIDAYVLVNAAGGAFNPILSDPGALGFEVYIGGSAGTALAVRGGGLSRELVSTTVMTTPLIWHRIAIRGDGLGGIGLYIDGVLEDSLAGQSLSSSGTGLVIGRSAAGGISFNGMIDEFGLWGDALVDALFAYSLDGLTFFPATAAPPSTNPLVGIDATPAPRTFSWDSVADAVGTPQPQLVDLEITVSSAGVPGIIEAAEGWVADNVNQCLHASAVPVVISQSAPALVSVNFPRGLIITDLIVTLDLEHPAMGELDVSLSHGATTVDLFTAQGGAAPLTAGARFHLFDSSVNPWGLHLPPRAGLAYTTETGSLPAFDGQDAMGDWTLRVSDGIAANNGAVRAFSICFIGTPLVSVSALAPPAGARPLELGSTDEVALQFDLTAMYGSTDLGSLTLSASGSGDDATDISAVSLIHDLDLSGTVSAGDAILYSQAAGFGVDNGTLIAPITPSLPLLAGVVNQLLVIYDVGVSGAVGETFQATLSAGVLPSSPGASIMGLPLSGDLLTLVLPTEGLNATANAAGAQVRAAGDVDVVALPFTLTTFGVVAIDVVSASISARGTGDDATHLANIRVFADLDSSSTLSAGDLQVAAAGSGYPVNDGVLTLPLSGVSVPGGMTTRAFLIVYDFSAAAPFAATFEALLTAVTATSPVGAPVIGLPLVGDLLAIDVFPAPACAILSPAGGSMLGGIVNVALNVTDAASDPTTTTFEFSTDAGVTWTPATAATGSPMSNPDLLRPTPFTSAFVWDSSADSVGVFAEQAVIFRAEVRDDPRFASTCMAAWSISNVPSCLISAPAIGALTSGEIAIVFAGAHPGLDPLDSVFEFSTDAGATWIMATAATTSAVANPDLGRPSPFSGVTFIWDSRADSVGLAMTTPVTFSVSVDDGLATRECTAQFDVDNIPACQITLPASGAMMAGIVDIAFDASHPAGVAVDLLFEISTDGGATFVMAVPAAASAFANPDLMRATPVVGGVFKWDSATTGVGLAAPQNALARITISDARGATSACEVSPIILDNPPSCTMTAPAPAALVAGRIDVSFDAAGPGTIPLTSTFDYSTDSGATWQLATPAAGSLVANPDVLRPTPISGLIFTWDSAADALGLVSPQSVIFRISVDNGSRQSTCGHALTVDNAPMCAISAPVGGALTAGNVAITFSGIDPSGDPLTSTFEFSTDAGATWVLATTAVASLVANPDVARPTPFTGVTFLWDSRADAVGLSMSAPVTLRVSVDDGSVTRACSVMIDVNNRPSCLIVSPLGGAMAAGDASIVFDASHPAGVAVDLAFEFSTDGGATFAPAVPSATSPFANPDLLRSTPVIAGVFIWDTITSGVGLTGSQNVMFRVTVGDDRGASNTCLVAPVVVDNLPTCLLSAPAGGAIVSDFVQIDFGGNDPAGSTLTSTLEFSSDGGATWLLLVAAAGSPASNPDVSRPTPFSGVTFMWDSRADVVTPLAPMAVILRLTVASAAASSACTVAVTVDNTAICTGICGDCNLDGQGPSVVDALTAAQIAVSLITPNLMQTGCCDIDSDKDIDILDSLRLAQKSAGLAVTLACL